MRWLVAGLLLGCGAGPAADVTYCGLLVEWPTDFALVQKMERWTMRAFTSSADVRLHDVCYASVGYAVERVDRVPDPRPGHEGGEVGGTTDCNRATIVVKSIEQTLPHELAHVAQGCDDDSVDHLNWERDVYPQIQMVRACLDAEEWEARNPNGCPWLVGGCPTSCPAGIRD